MAGFKAALEKVYNCNMDGGKFTRLWIVPLKFKPILIKRKGNFWEVTVKCVINWRLFQKAVQTKALVHIRCVIIKVREPEADQAEGNGQADQVADPELEKPSPVSPSTI